MMKKSKLWAKFKIREELHRWWGVEGGIDEGGIHDVMKIIDQIDGPEALSQELPVIPEFVADWIEENRERYENMFFSIGWDLYDNSIHPDVDSWLIENQEKFVKAWFDGYEVEEPMYHALIKGHELLNIDGIYWTYDKNDHDVFFSVLSSPYGNFATEMSKAEWNKLGIDESNADFVKVDAELN